MGAITRGHSAHRIVGDLYFITITVVDWVDIFTRPRYKHIIVDSLAYCQKHKGLRVFAWVLMPNHLHAIIATEGSHTVGDIMRDFKKFTSKRVVNELENDSQESRRKWMLDRFRFRGDNDRKITFYRLWQDGYHPVSLTSYEMYQQKLDYIHDNPVRHEFVSRPEGYLYSSAVNFAGGKGLLPLSPA